jgi:hypothetical protein
MPRQPNTCRAVVAEMERQGIPVHYEPGWETRGSATFSPRGLVVHHTADGPGEYPSLRIVRDGRSDLPGPLAQWGLGRSGKVYLIAAGRANHAGSGGWRGLSGNSTVWGIEAESTGRGDWTDAQRRNYPRLAAALARHQPFGVDMICAHREWTPRKPDPAGIDMHEFRAEVARLLRGAPSPTPAPIPTPLPPEEDDDMLLLKFRDQFYQWYGGRLVHIPWDHIYLIQYLEKRYNLTVQEVRSRSVMLNFAGLDGNTGGVYIP